MPILAFQPLKFSEASLLALTKGYCPLPSKNRSRKMPPDQPGAIHSPLSQDGTGSLEGSREELQLRSHVTGEAGGKIIESRSCHWESKCLMWCHNAGARWLFLKTLKDKTKRSFEVIIEYP